LSNLARIGQSNCSCLRFNKLDILEVHLQQNLSITQTHPDHSFHRWGLAE